MIRKLYEKYREVFWYLVFGALTTLVSLAVYFGCILTFLDPGKALQLQAANVISWIAAVTFAYFTNRKWVFCSENKKIVKEAVSFYSARIATLLIEMAFMFLTVTLLHGNDKIMKLIAQGVVVVSNYLFSKFWVFRKEK